jgi:hypothetical protein
MKNPIDSLLGKGKQEKDQLSADAMAVRLGVNPPLEPLTRQEITKSEPGKIIKSEDLQEERHPGRPARLCEFEIRDNIQKSLSLRPMGLWELCRSVDSSLDTTKKHVEYLCRLGVCQKIEFNDAGKRKIIYSRK